MYQLVDERITVISWQPRMKTLHQNFHVKSVASIYKPAPFHHCMSNKGVLKKAGRISWLKMTQSQHIAYSSSVLIHLFFNH